MENQIFLSQCPYDDCANQLAVPNTAETGDVIVCRTLPDSIANGCNRNVEVKNLQKAENGNLTAAELAILEIDEDWGQ